MKTIAPAKLTRPSSRGALPRERLFRLIEGSREKKVIWVSGPAGSGKTTVAAGYFDSCEAPCLWYQLDEGDADLSTLFYYLGVASKHAAPRYRRPLPLLTPEYLLGIPVFAKRFFEQLCERLLGKTRFGPSFPDGGAAIVFDNYQDIPEESAFHEVMNAGLAAIPRGVSVIILSRSEPPPAYARLRAAGEMSFLGWDEIRLTAEESDAIATLKAGKDLGRETLSHLRRAADGWVAGLVLLLESLRLEELDPQVPGDLPRETIFSYFATELFDRSSRDVRDFLLETAFLPRMSARMAEALTGNPRSSRIFSALNRKHYFIARYASQGQEYQYHPLFREFLLDKANETLAPARLPDLRSRAAKVLEENGYAEDAVSLFREAEEWSEASRVILTHAPTLMSQGRWQTLRGWIEALPEPVMEQDPWLLYWLGASMLPTSPEKSKECFSGAFERFRSIRDAAGSFLALSGMLDSVSIRFDTVFELDQLIPLTGELLEAYHHQFPSPEIESRMTASMLNALVLGQPANPALEYWRNRGLALAEDAADMDTALRILLSLSFHRMLSGEPEKVPLILEAFHKRVEAGPYTPLYVLLQRDVQAFYHWLSADFQRNRWATEDGIALADATGVHILDPYLNGHGAAGALSLGEVARAEGFLQKMQCCLRIVLTAHGETLYHNLMAWNHLLQHQLILASQHADLAIKFGTAMGVPMLAPYQHLIKAMVMHELKDDGAASTHLGEVRKILGTHQLRQAEFMALLVEAWIAFDRGDEASGRECLRRAMALGREHGYANGFFWVNSMVAGLCVKALEAGIETDYVQGLIRRRNLMPDVPVHNLDNWPWQLRIYTLGQFELERDGVPVTFTGKVQQKPLRLLKALIAFGGREVNQEQLSDALWPDAEGDLAYRSFETTLYRLRRLLGKDKALLLNEGRLTLDRQSCWVDAFALDRILTEAEALWKSWRPDQRARQASQDAAEKAMQLTQKAVALYQGHFLEGEAEQLWLLSPRERLRAKVIRGIATLGGYWEACGAWETAVACYEKGLEVDDLAEEFYQHLMLCYHKLRRQAKALAVYRRCRAVLKAGLGMEPSADTKSLLHRLRSGQ